MRRSVFFLPLIATLAGGLPVIAQPRLRLAQSPNYSACMMTCSAIHMTCQQSCSRSLVPGFSDNSLVAQCVLNCTTAQLACQQNLRRPLIGRNVRLSSPHSFPSPGEHGV